MAVSGLVGSCWLRRARSMALRYWDYACLLCSGGIFRVRRQALVRILQWVGRKVGDDAADLLGPMARGSQVERVVLGLCPDDHGGAVAYVHAVSPKGTWALMTFSCHPCWTTS